MTKVQNEKFFLGNFRERARILGSRSRNVKNPRNLYLWPGMSYLGDSAQKCCFLAAKICLAEFWAFLADLGAKKIFIVKICHRCC